jgi:hypothetical protein
LVTGAAGIIAEFADKNPTMRARTRARRGATMDALSPNGDNRDSRGRFLPGHQGGPGNPFARRSAAIRTAFLEAISPQDIRAIVRTLVEKAKAGDLVAAKLVLLWAIGRPSDPVFPDAIARQIAAEAQGDQRPLPLPAEREVHLDAELHRTLARLTDPEACLNVAGRALATEIRILRGAGTAPGDLSVK